LKYNHDEDIFPNLAKPSFSVIINTLEQIARKKKSVVGGLSTVVPGNQTSCSYGKALLPEALQQTTDNELLGFLFSAQRTHAAEYLPLLLDDGCSGSQLVSN
jgi:hypothetical protein